MQHMVLEKPLRVGNSAEKDKRCKFHGFSMAEMLVVLLIMSFIAIGVPLIHFKKAELKTKRSIHGRYECYYNGGALTQYSVNEDGVEQGPDAVTECRFAPPKSAIFFMVHAVGGGGGASSATSSTTGGNNTDGGEYLASQVNTFPQWAKDAQAAGYLKEPMEAPYTISRTGSQYTFIYGKSGTAGETMSMFFPNLSNIQIVMRPGNGGALEGSGTQTEVDFYRTDPNNAEAGAELITTITAAGGEGGSGSGQMTLWMDGDGPLCEIKEKEDRQFNQADFGENIELDTDTNMESSFSAELRLAGSGGAGAYTKASAGTVSYSINGTNIPSNVVKKPTCDEPLECEEGVVADGGNNCPAQTGKDGAVVILW